MLAAAESLMLIHCADCEIADNALEAVKRIIEGELLQSLSLNGELYPLRVTANAVSHLP